MDGLAKRFAELADNYGPDVVNTALNAVRMEAYSCLAGSFLWAGIAYTMYRAGRYLIRIECDDKFDNDFVRPFGYILIGLCIFPFVSFVWTWLDPWTWAAIYHPELYIAKKVLYL